MENIYSMYRPPGPVGMDQTGSAAILAVKRSADEEHEEASKGINSGSDTQSRRHQKSKTGVSVPPLHKRNDSLQIFFFKKNIQATFGSHIFLDLFYRIRHWDIMQLSKQEIGDEAATRHRSILETHESATESAL